MAVDSVAALVPKTELEAEIGEQAVGLQARMMSKAMRRLQSILEEDYGRGKRPTIAGGARKPATGSPFRG